MVVSCVQYYKQNCWYFVSTVGWEWDCAQEPDNNDNLLEKLVETVSDIRIKILFCMKSRLRNVKSMKYKQIILEGRVSWDGVQGPHPRVQAQKYREVPLHLHHVLQTCPGTYKTFQKKNTEPAISDALNTFKTRKKVYNFFVSWKIRHKKGVWLFRLLKYVLRSV